MKLFKFGIPHIKNQGRSPYKCLKTIQKFIFNNNLRKKFGSNLNEGIKNEELKEVKSLSEFKSGVSLSSEGKFDQAEYHLKECLKILKNSNQVESVSYLYVLKKYNQVLFFSKKFIDCEKSLKVSIELSRVLFKNKPELTFNFYQNLIAFYTYTDINKASGYIEGLIDDEKMNDKLKKYFVFAGGAIKILNNEYSLAKQYISEVIGYNDFSSLYGAYNLHNFACLNLELKREYELICKEGTEEIINKWKNEFNFTNTDTVEKESFILFKQCLAKLEFNSKLDRSEKESELLKTFLFSQAEIPSKKLNDDEEEIIVNSFKNTKSGITLTNIAEMLFEKGTDKEKETAFWLKTGIKHYEAYEKENISRHLIIFALFYSQLGQTLYAEGLYRKAIELLSNVIL